MHLLGGSRESKKWKERSMKYSVREDQIGGGEQEGEMVVVRQDGQFLVESVHDAGSSHKPTYL